MTKKILVIQACFYEEISKKLLEGASSILKNHDQEYKVLSVPGCFEIPAALYIAEVSNNNYLGYIVLGCVIKGETSHYDIVCSESSRGINQFAMTKKRPVGFGIITSENYDQAKERADINKQNYGGKAASACLEMIDFCKKV